MRSLIFRHYLSCLVLMACTAFGSSVFGQESAQDAVDRVESDAHQANRVDPQVHTKPPPTTRVDRLIERARDENWSADDLFSHLELDSDDGCRHFGDRAYLRERHARWSEAVALLNRVDPDALDAWLMGLGNPPTTVKQETTRQLRCMLHALIEATTRDGYDIRLFANINRHFGGRFSDPQSLARAIEDRPRLFEHTFDAVTRSLFRNIHSQAHIWYRKFQFTGRAFNKVSEEAAHKCGLTHTQIWRPESEYHKTCWFRHLSPPEREREILQASAAPGLSRHHWGTDVDILGLNPRLFHDGGSLHDDWRWLDDHALDFGFFQTYRDADPDRRAHMEERWHWSYYPIGQALWDFIYHHQERFEASLFERWDRYDRNWGGRTGPYFDHMREYWRDYLFNIYLPNVDARPTFEDSQQVQESGDSPLP